MKLKSCSLQVQNKFVTPTSISALTKKKTYIDVFDDDPGCITHVDIVKMLGFVYDCTSKCNLQLRNVQMVLRTI